MLTSSEDIKKSLSKGIYQQIFDLYDTKPIIRLDSLLSYYKSNLQKDIIFGLHQDANEVLSYILDDVDVKDSFQVKINQTLISEDGNESKMTYSENILIVPLKESLQKSIDSYFEEETVNKQKIVKQQVNSPNHLFVTVLRMKYENSIYTKINDEITVEDYIIYCGKRYKIISYILHDGNTQSGHYRAVKKENNKWTMFDDINKYEIDSDCQKLAYIYLLQREDIIIYNELEQHFKTKDPKSEILISRLVNTTTEERQMMKSFYLSLSKEDKDIFISKIKYELGEMFTENDFILGLDMVVDPNCINPLTFTSFLDVCRFVSSIRNKIKEFKLSIWFDLTYEDRCILSQN